MNKRASISHIKRQSVDAEVFSDSIYLVQHMFDSEFAGVLALFLDFSAHALNDNDFLSLI